MCEWFVVFYRRYNSLIIEPGAVLAVAAATAIVMEAAEDKMAMARQGLGL